MAGKTTVGQYLVTRLEQAGLNHIFGIPGDYVLGFYDLLVESKIDVVGTCTEIGAGFAADGYARVNGLGALCVTYCVGGLNVLNAVAGAYAEKSPVIAISGSPGLSERAHSPLLHHQVRDFNTQLEIYEMVRGAAVSLDAPVTAPKGIYHFIT
jgi:indolepyruvate decarboxylase